MIAKRIKSDEEYILVIQGLVRQLQDAEDEVLCLRRDRDRALQKLTEITARLEQALEHIVRLQA